MILVESGTATVDIRKDTHCMRINYVRAGVLAGFDLREIGILNGIFSFCEQWLDPAGLEGYTSSLASTYPIGYTHPQASMLAAHPRRMLTTSSAAVRLLWNRNSPATPLLILPRY